MRSEKYTIHYPSGQEFTAIGAFVLAPIPNTSYSNPCIFTDDKAFILDPRAVILLSSNIIVYEPADNDQMQDEFVDWMNENGEDWPSRILGRKDSK